MDVALQTRVHLSKIKRSGPPQGRGAPSNQGQSGIGQRRPGLGMVTRSQTAGNQPHGPQKPQQEGRLPNLAAEEYAKLSPAEKDTKRKAGDQWKATL